MKIVMKIAKTDLGWSPVKLFYLMMIILVLSFKIIHIPYDFVFDVVIIVEEKWKN
jgi:hypothetical protein